MENNNRQGCRWWTDELVYEFLHLWYPLYAKPEKTVKEYIAEFKASKSESIEPCATSSEIDKRILELESELKRLYQRNELK